MPERPEGSLPHLVVEISNVSYSSRPGIQEFSKHISYDDTQVLFFYVPTVHRNTDTKKVVFFPFFIDKSKKS